jgi:hypothetical protein
MKDLVNLLVFGMVFLVFGLAIFGYLYDRALK